MPLTAPVKKAFKKYKDNHNGEPFKLKSLVPIGLRKKPREEEEGEAVHSGLVSMRRRDQEEDPWSIGLATEMDAAGLIHDADPNRDPLVGMDTDGMTVSIAGLVPPPDPSYRRL
jgi:hypothetical protein